MTIAFGTPITSNFSSSTANSFTLSSLTLAADNYAILSMTVVIKSAVTLPPSAAPVWNGQSFTLIANVEDLTGDAQSRMLVYGIKASAGATSDVTWGFDQFCPASASVVSVSGQNTTTALGSVVTQSQWATSGWAVPSQNVTDSTSGDVIFAVLGSPGWDAGFSNMSGVAWTPAGGQTSLFDQNNSAGGSNGYARILASTKSGASGSVNVAYSNDSGQPAFQFAAFAIKAAASFSIDTIDADIEHGQSGSFTYTGLGTITAMTVDGINVTTVSGTGGSGTYTMPARVDGAVIAGHGTQAVVITGTLGSASTTIDVVEAAAQQYVTITSLGTGVGALATYYGIATTDEITSDTPATLGVTTSNIGADTLIHTDYYGTQTIWWWDASTKVVTKIYVINGVVASAIGLTSSGLTVAKLTSSGLTSSPM